MFIDTLLHTKQTKGIFTQHRLRRLAFFVGILSVLTLGCMTQEKEFPNGTIIDLSHAFDETTIFWPTEEGFKLEKEFAGLTDKGYYYAANKLCTAEHGGTHIDAPIHFAEGRMSVDQIPLEQLIGKAVVIDVSSQCENNADYQVGVSDIESWEKSNGTVPTKSIVIFRTGYSKRWPDRKSYMGTDERGAGAVAKLHFPGLHKDAALWLIKNRQIKAVGLDTPSIDYGQSTLFETHRELFDKNIPAFENLANLDKLPVKDFSIIALPMKIKGGSGAPLRIVAIVQ